MRIHSDILTEDDLRSAVASEINNNNYTAATAYLEVSHHGSRKRDHAFEVHLYGDPGKDRHGIARRYSTGGAYGTTDGIYRALTWVEWGDVICRLFTIDPRAIIGSYDGFDDFMEQTQTYAPHRSQFYDAVEHANRWYEELYWEARARSEAREAVGA